jgi:hypothetical protein
LWASGRFTIRARSRTTRSSTETPPTNTCAHLSVVSAKFLSSTDGRWRLGPVCYPRGQPRQTRTLDRPSACCRRVPASIAFPRHMRCQGREPAGFSERQEHAAARLEGTRRRRPPSRPSRRRRAGSCRRRRLRGLDA